MCVYDLNLADIYISLWHRSIWDAYRILEICVKLKSRHPAPNLGLEGCHIHLFHCFSHWCTPEMNTVGPAPATSLLKLPILWTIPPCPPNPPLLICIGASSPAALHFTLICECEFYQTSIFSFESYPNGHFIVLQARYKLSAQYCAFPSVARPPLIPSPVL